MSLWFVGRVSLSLKNVGRIIVRNNFKIYAYGIPCVWFGLFPLVSETNLFPPCIQASSILKYLKFTDAFLEGFLLKK